jgi:2-keto-4-pentenoate hydratase/2-oxohepta-3-ene-1,7-dioic acid hydratase in catechol pathway
VQLFTTTEGLGRRNGDQLELLDGADDLDVIIRTGAIDWARTATVRAVVDLASATFRAPVRPTRLIQVGLNYHSHLAEIGRPALDKPMYGITEVGDALSGPGAVITFPADDADQVDHECEIALVIGSEAHEVRSADAWSVIAGVTACNDVSARGLQRAGMAAGNFGAGKMLPGFKPLGPGLLTTDEVRDGLLTMQLTVNGELRQKTDLSDMVFSIPHLIEVITADHTLVPGDVVMTGSPAGVGFFSGKYLHDGDVVEITVGTLPPLRNTFRKG